MNNLPAAMQSNAIDFKSPEIIKTLKATVAVGLNDAEFMMFAEHCKGTGLNPFKKEVWAIKTKGYTNKRGEFVEGKVQIMTGINGFHTIANDNPQYDGIEVGLIDPNGDYKSQAYPKNDYIGAWCKVYRKDRRMPIESAVMLAEYDKSLTEYNYPDKGIWKTMKRVMIQKCAESVGLRKAFPQQFNGMYTAEEMPAEFAAPQAQVKQVWSDPENSNQGGQIIDVDTETGEVIEQRPAQPVAQGWDALPWRYHLPVKKEGKDMDATRTWLKKHGFRFNGDDKHWYGPIEVPKLAEYLRPLGQEKPEAAPVAQPEPRQEIKVADDDELPWDTMPGEVDDPRMPNI